MLNETVLCKHSDVSQRVHLSNHNRLLFKQHVCRLTASKMYFFFFTLTSLCTLLVSIIYKQIKCWTQNSESKNLFVKPHHILTFTPFIYIWLTYSLVTNYSFPKITINQNNFRVYFQYLHKLYAGTEISSAQ